MKEKINKKQELILWKGKQNWPASGQVHQQEDPNKQDKKWKRRKKKKKPETTKYKKLYGNNMKKCQQPGWPGRDGQVSRNTQVNKIESRRDI